MVVKAPQVFRATLAVKVLWVHRVHREPRALREPLDHKGQQEPQGPKVHKAPLEHKAPQVPKAQLAHKAPPAPAHKALLEHKALTERKGQLAPVLKAQQVPRAPLVAQAVLASQKINCYL